MQDNSVSNLRSGVWLFGIGAWLFGIIDRSVATLSDGFLSSIDLVQLFTASFFFASWLLLVPLKLK